MGFIPLGVSWMRASMSVTGKEIVMGTSMTDTYFRYMMLTDTLSLISSIFIVLSSVLYIAGGFLGGT